MAWTYGGVTIVVEKDSGDKVTPRLDEINPLTSSLTTYINYAGTEAYTRELTVVMFENYASLTALIDGQSHALVSDHGAQGSYLITDANPNRVQDVKKDAPVVRVDLKLLKVS